jgi:predicted transposase/invertase (TIGR01784 family)
VEFLCGNGGVLGRRKKLQELTIKDPFMFVAVMVENPEECKKVLELALGFPIEQVKVSKEKSLVYNPEYHGVRLDIFAEDEKHTHYNVEMQVRKTDVEKRSRYYHSQMDMESLLTGVDYSELPDTYVIFICDYDPFGEKKYRYTVRRYLEEAENVDYYDGVHTVFLSTKGENEDEVPRELVKFLKYVHAEQPQSEWDYDDDFVCRLQEAVTQIKVSREMGARYMTLEELLKDEREEGRAEGLQDIICDFLMEAGFLDNSLRNQIESISDLEVLKNLSRKAARTKSAAEFKEYLDSQL